MSNEGIEWSGLDITKELRDARASHSPDIKPELIEDVERKVDPALAAFDAAEKVIQDFTSGTLRTARRARNQNAPPSSNSLSNDDDEYEEAPYESEEEYVLEEDSAEAMRLPNEPDDDFYFPPGMGGHDTRPEALVNQLKDLFSSDDDEEDEDEDDNEDFLEEEREPAQRKRLANRPMGKVPLKDEALTYYQLAQQEFQMGKLDDAILMIEETIKLDPNSKLPYILLDTIYSDKGDFDKALKAKVAAALLDKNKDDWIDVARISVEKDHLEQAILFYGRAIELDEGDHETMYELVELYMKMNRISLACDMMKKVHAVYPASAEYTSQLARLFMMQGMLQDAVNLFENILLQNKENSFIDPDVIQPFGWSELNSLSELYYKQKAWHKNIRAIKSISRWLLDRGDETWWDDIQTDAEYDDRRFDIKRVGKAKGNEDPNKYQLPLDIRTKLLLSRLQLDDINEAREHSKKILEADSDVYLDLFWEVGIEFMELGYYDTGLLLLEKLLDANDSPSELLLAIGRCQMGVENWVEAENNFRVVSEYDPHNVEALVGLAETCYALDRDEEARALIEEIQEIRQELAEQEAAQKKNSPSSEKEEDKSTFYKRPERVRLFSAKTTLIEKQKAEQEAIAKVENHFRTLQRYWSQLAQNVNNVVAVSEWAQIANTLVTMFLSVKRLTHKHGSRLTSFQKGEDADIDARLEKLSLRIAENDIDAVDEENEGPGKSITVFRGLPVDTWFDIFMQYALLLAAYESATSSYRILGAAKQVVIFNEPKKMEIMKYVHMGRWTQ